MRHLARWMDDSIPEGQRQEILEAAKQLRAAALRIAGVRWTFNPRDPIADELGDLLVDIDVAEHHAHQFAAAHPARKH